MDSLDTVHGLLGQCPWTPWTLSMESVESLDNYILDKVQGANTGWTMDSVESLDIVGGYLDEVQLDWTVVCAFFSHMLNVGSLSLQLKINHRWLTTLG